MGVPRELHAIDLQSREATVSWLPPTQQRGFIDAYRLKYSARDGSQGDEVVLRMDQLSCRKFSQAAVSVDSLCYTITGLQPVTNYQVQVQARSSTGAWGGWSPVAYFTTKERKCLVSNIDRILSKDPRMSMEPARFS